LSDDPRATCPECGEPLMVEMITDEKTGRLKISVGCEGTADDEFEFEISTGLYEEDFDELEIGKQIKMVGAVMRRKSDPELEDAEQ